MTLCIIAEAVSRIVVSAVCLGTFAPQTSAMMLKDAAGVGLFDVALANVGNVLLICEDATIMMH